jgi:polysaccharide chain length determinant protein (PEP-CTERM system associated)
MTHQEPESTLDYGAILRRRRWSLILPTVLGVVVGVALAWLLPREYVATATLAVTSPSMSGGLGSSSQADQVERIRAVSHELLSTPVVEQVARDERLLDSAPLDEVVIDIRRRTSVTVPPKPLSATGRLEPDTFLVAYSGQTPEIAQRVANRLTQVFVEKHSKMRETRAEDTSAFLERQLTNSRERVNAAETNLREAKASFQGRLPEQALANLQAVTELRQQRESASQALSTERDRVSVLDQQIEGLRQDQQAAASAAIEARSQERLSALEQQLAEARLQYTPRHPEVQRLESDLARARAEIAEERKQASAAAVPPSTDPALRALVAERDQARLRMKDLEASASRTQAELARYQGMLNEAPLVEQRLTALSQTYDFEKQQYQKLAEQYQAALLNEDLERRQAGERFVVLYSAQRPRRAASPNVALVLAASIVGGLVFGAALAMLREFLDRSVHDRRTLEAEYGRPVLAEIPHF